MCEMRPIWGVLAAVVAFLMTQGLSTSTTSPTVSSSATPNTTNSTNATEAASNSTAQNTSSSTVSSNQTLEKLVNFTAGIWDPTLEALFTNKTDCSKQNFSWCKLKAADVHGVTDYYDHVYNLSNSKYIFLCQSKKGNYGFIKRQQFTFDVVSGPEKILLKDVQCLNVVYDGITKDGYLIHFLFGGRRVHFYGCRYTIVTKNCRIEASHDAPVTVPGYGNWTTATYSVYLNHRDYETCKIYFPCLNKGRKLGDGSFSLKGYFVKGWTRPEATGRKLLSINEANPDEDCGAHTHFKEASSHHLVTPFKDGPGNVISICNGSKFFHGRMPENLGCHSIRSIKVSHHCGHHKTKCIVEPELKDCSHGKCISIKLSNKGMVRLSRGSSTETVKCGLECLLPPLDGEGDILIDCPSGTQHFLQKNIVDLDCPTHTYFREFMLYVCRASHHPVTTIVFFMWVSIGYLLLSILCSITFYSLKLTCKAMENMQDKLSKSFICEICKMTYKGNLAKELHEVNCNNGLCPFCSSRLPESSLNKHAQVCPRRSAVEGMLKEHELYNSTPKVFVFIFGISEHVGTLAKRTTWVVVMLILLIVAVSPVRGDGNILYEGIGDEQMAPGLWEEEMELVEGCHQECYITETECVCPSFETGRKLLFYHLLNKHVRSGRKMKLLSSISLETPWGVVKIEKGFKPTQSVSNLQLSWTSEEEVGGKVILSGKSTAIIKLKEKTGAVWELGSDKALEKKKLIVSVMDFSQEYKTNFQYLTGDRLVSEWPRATCTGPCPDRCACHTSTCLWKAWPNSRKWTCNPTWCWGVGTGCTCCGIDIEKPYQTYLAAKWLTEYIKTDVVVCVELSEEERHCDIIQAGSRFHLGPITVLISDPQNVEKKLPMDIATIYKVQSGEVDLMHVSKVITASSLCKLQSCTHGSAGDMQIFKPDYLVKHCNSKKLNTLEDSGWANDTWMSWQGCDLDYFCTTGSWPTCTFSGVVKQNTDAFRNLDTSEFNLMEEYFFHSLRTEIGGRTMAFPVKARPTEGGGEITVLVEVNGLELHSKLVKPVGLSFKITSCKGCYSCSSGFYCDVVVGIESPAELTVHVESNNPNIILTESSILAKQGASAKIKGFATLKKTKFCCTLLESKLTDKHLSDCTDLNLDDPQDIIIERGSTLLSHQNDTCSNGFGCWLTNAGSFGRGIYTMFTDYFGSFIIGLLFFILPVVLLIVFFCIGKRMFFCRRFRGCCKPNKEDKEKLKELLKNIKFGSREKPIEGGNSWRQLANKALGKIK
nr:glycoprotein precursor [Nairoviridae sp.]